MSQVTNIYNDDNSNTEQSDLDQPDLEQPDLEQPDLDQPDLEQPDLDQPDLEHELNFNNTLNIPTLNLSNNDITSINIISELNNLITQNEEELERRRNSPGKIKNIKYLKSLNKHLRTFKGKLIKYTKQKNKRKNPTSIKEFGFNKRSNISNEMAEFADWQPGDMKSRVDITKYLCKYIKDNNLQHPYDKRTILPDEKLTKLLKCEGKDLNYWKMQTFIKDANIFV
jgi:chromatin remodeling complex protein RSC6